MRNKLIVIQLAKILGQVELYWPAAVLPLSFTLQDGFLYLRGIMAVHVVTPSLAEK